MTPRAVVALGIGQCINWGVLYYAFAALVVPLQMEHGFTTWEVAAAFSLALATSAAAAPAIGRLGDRGHGPRVMQVGGFSAAALLLLWALVPSAVTLYVVWGGLGLCMATALYEPAFVIVGRAFVDPAKRLRALAAVTLFGGLASTIFLPGTTFLIAAVGPKGAVVVLAVLMVASTCVTRTFVFRHLPAASPSTASESPVASVRARGAAPAPVPLVATIFAASSLVSSAFTANLVPALGERGISPATAAILGGLIGVMQLPGRALLMNGALPGPPARLLAISLVLQAAGLGGIAFAPSMFLAAAGTMVFSLGAGLITLVRPHLVQTMCFVGSGGYLNGRIARHQQLARAAGPLAIAWLAGLVGYTTVFTVIAGTLATMAVASQGAPAVHNLEIHKETI